MDLRDLRYFLACVQHKSIHAAAEALHISQPAVSKAVHRLEEELGVPLLDRLPRGVMTTPYGEALERYAKMIEHDVRRATSEIDAMRGATKGRVLLGITPTLVNDVVSDAVAQIMRDYPKLSILIRIGLSTNLLPALLNGDIDVTLMLVRSHTALPEIIFEPLIKVHPVIVARRDHPLAGKPDVPLAELGRFPWLMPETPVEHRQLIYRSFIDAGLPPPAPAVEANVAVFFGPLIAKTDLLTVMPHELIIRQMAIDNLTTIDTSLAFGTETIGFAYRAQATLLPGVKLLMAAVRAVFAQAPNAIKRRQEHSSKGTITSSSAHRTR
jgi:DNA-binding transcriptional LysR family regulator